VASSLASWTHATLVASPQHHTQLLQAVQEMALGNDVTARATLQTIPDASTLAAVRDHLLAVSAWNLEDWPIAVAATKDPRIRLHLLLDRVDGGNDREALRRILFANGQPSPDEVVVRSLLENRPSRKLVLPITRNESASDRPSAEFRARVHLALGEPKAALQALRELERDSLTNDAIYHLERARCWLALHRPTLALAELDPASGFRCVFRPHRRLHAELTATALAMLGDRAGAAAHLRAAMVATRSDDVSVRTRLTLHFAETLNSLGQREEALAALLALPGERADRTHEWPEVRRMRRELALALEREDQPVGDALSADFWSSVVERCAAEPAAALRDLINEAETSQAWLQAYSRFLGPTVGAKEIAQLENRGRIAITALRTIAMANPIPDTGSAWRVFETFATPLVDALAARGVPGHFADEEPLFENTRADWLADPTAKEGARRLADLAAAEHRQREAQPWLSGTLLPAQPNPMQLRTHMPHSTCMLLIAGDRRSGLACRITRQGIAWIPYEVSPGLGRADEGMSPQRHARDILTQLLGDTFPWRQVVLVPTGPIHELPWEAAVVGPTSTNHEPMVLVRAPSARAWLARARQNAQEDADGSGHGEAKIVALFAGEGCDPRGEEWSHRMPAPENASLQVFTGNKASMTQLQRIGRPRCLVLSAPFGDRVAGTRYGLRLADGETRSLQDGLHLHSLLQLEVKSTLCIVHVAGEASSHELSSLAGIVQGLWAAGCRTVLTIPASVPLGEVAPLLQTMATAAVARRDPATAWAEALREHQSTVRESARFGLQLWTAP
jgi:hypothetical protein